MAPSHSKKRSRRDNSMEKGHEIDLDGLSVAEMESVIAELQERVAKKASERASGVVSCLIKLMNGDQYPHIYRRVIFYLGPADIASLSKTCRMLSDVYKRESGQLLAAGSDRLGATQVVSPITWNIHRALGDFFDDTNEFLARLRMAEGLVVGRLPLEYFGNVRLCEVPCMTILVRAVATSATKRSSGPARAFPTGFFVDWFPNSENFEVQTVLSGQNVPESDLHNDIDIPLFVMARDANFRICRKYVQGELSAVVRIVICCHQPSCEFLRCAPSTAFLNCFTSKSAFSLMPKMLFQQKQDYFLWGSATHPATQQWPVICKKMSRSELAIRLFSSCAETAKEQRWNRFFGDRSSFVINFDGSRRLSTEHLGGRKLDVKTLLFHIASFILAVGPLIGPDGTARMCTYLDAEDVGCSAIRDPILVPFYLKSSWAEFLHRKAGAEIRANLVHYAPASWPADWKNSRIFPEHNVTRPHLMWRVRSWSAPSRWQFADNKIQKWYEEWAESTTTEEKEDGTLMNVHNQNTS